MTLWLEIFFVSFVDGGVRYFKRLEGITDKETDPDDMVMNFVLAELDTTPNVLKDDYVIHSTSWRYSPINDIYLTYFVCSEEIDFGSHATKELFEDEMEIAENEDIKRPRPVFIDEKHVVSHGVKHLALLVKTKPEKYNRAFSEKSLIFLNSVESSVQTNISKY